ncbi:hypothetical protein T484DRAFT_1886283, partial [Baffinella frigidus]
MTQEVMRLVQTALVLLACAVAQVPPEITFHSPQPGQTVLGRSFTIEVEVASSFHVPEEGKGVLFLDGGKLLEVRQQRVTVSMDGAGGLFEGQHTLRLVLLALDGSTVATQQVLFLKEGAPEETAGPFHDDKYDDEALHEMQAACAPLADLPRDPPPPRSRDDPAVIALGLPVLSSLTKYDGEEADDMRMAQEREGFINDASQLPMFEVFIPSLLANIPLEKGHYRYDVYLGYDLGDPLFDDAPSRESIHRQLVALVGEAPVTFLWFHIHRQLVTLVGEAPVTFLWFQYQGMEGKVFWIYNDLFRQNQGMEGKVFWIYNDLFRQGMAGKVVWIYNDLFRQAYEDGADYFYMVNDDLLIVTPGWADRFVGALQEGPLGRDFGVAGPLDIRDRHKHHMCFAFHSRLHYDIFGTFYPPAFQNWWSDTWASLVYGAEATFWFKDIEVRNTEVEGRRYPAFWEGADYMAEEVSAGRRRVAAYCSCVVSGGSWRYQSCRTAPSPPPPHRATP